MQKIKGFFSGSGSKAAAQTDQQFAAQAKAEAIPGPVPEAPLVTAEPQGKPTIPEAKWSSGTEVANPAVTSGPPEGEAVPGNSEPLGTNTSQPPSVEEQAGAAETTTDKSSTGP